MEEKIMNIRKREISHRVLGVILYSINKFSTTRLYD